MITLNSLFRSFLIIISMSFIIISTAQSQSPDWLTDVTSEVGLDSAIGSRILLVDINNDNYPDLLWGSGNLNKNRYKLYLNIENPDQNSQNKRLFEDITEKSGMNINRDPSKEGRIIDVAAMADIDNDGDMDLVTSIYYHRLQMYQGDNDPGDRSEVYLNDGTGKFTLLSNNGLHDISVIDTLPSGLVNATGMAFLDYDYDGILDLYISTWFSDYAANLSNSGLGYKMPDIVLKGNGDGSFTYIKNSGTEGVVEPMYGVNVTDWDNDGWQDIITSAYCRSGGSIFKNLGTGKFDNVSNAANYSGQHLGGDHGQALCQWEAQPADFDNDGDMDLLQVSVHGGYDVGEGRTTISVNQGAENGFRYEWDLNRLERDAPKSTTHFGDQGGQWFDLDGDTKLDVAVANMGYQNPQANVNVQGQVRLYILKQNDEGQFMDISKSIGIYETMKDGHSMEPCDFDLDGDEDLFFSHMKYDTTEVDGEQVISENMQIVLLRNDIGNKNNSIEVKLSPPDGCNKSGIGARITVHSGNLSQIREIQAGLGHFSGQQHFIKYFGLKDNQIDSIVVRWPKKDLQLTTVKYPPVNTVIDINEAGFKGYIIPNENQKGLIAFESAYLNYPLTDINTSNIYPLKVWNKGDKNITISSLNFASNDSNVYSLDVDYSGEIIEPGKSITVNIEFTPIEREHYTGKLIVSSDADNNPVSYIFLSGEGFEEKPLIQINTTDITFNPVWIDSVSSEIINIGNPGELDLIIGGISFSGTDASYFEFYDIELPITIPSKESKQLSISFKPDEIRLYSAELLINSNAYKNEVLKIVLSGECSGPLPSINLSRSALFFSKVNVGEFKELTLDITNSGNALLVVDKINISGDIDNVYTFPGTDFPIELAAGKKYPLIVRLTPIEEESYDYEMVVSSNDPVKPVETVNLKGSGRATSSVFKNGLNDLLSIEVMPNPINSNGLISVRINSGRINNCNLYISDAKGRTVMELLNNVSINSDIEFPVSSLSKGVYFVRFFSSVGLMTLPFIVE